MPAILTTGSTVMCPHGGQATLFTSNTEALIDGVPALLITDIHPIAGCPFAPVTPLPCLTIQWITGATQANVHGVPMLLQNSVGLCINPVGAPQGTAIVVQTQQRAQAI